MLAAGALLQALHEESGWARLEVEAGGLVAIRGTRRRVVPWSRVANATAEGVVVKVELFADETLGVERLRAACTGEAEAQSLARLIVTASLDAGNGPFRRHACATEPAPASANQRYSATISG
jgi:hypothetical protein